MNPLQSLLGRYDRLVILDTETTGLSASRDEIIEFAAAVVENREGQAAVTAQYDQLAALSPGGFVPAGSGACPKPASAGISGSFFRETPCFLPITPILT